MWGLFAPISFDRFAQGPRDPQDDPVVDECVQCGGEIYDGEPCVKRIHEGLIHDSEDRPCLEEYARDKHVPVDYIDAIDVVPGHEPPPWAD